MSDIRLPTTVVSRYVQPEWLLDNADGGGRPPPRVRAQEIWRIGPVHIEAAQKEGTLVVVQYTERTGIDIVSDGEARRESYSTRVAPDCDRKYLRRNVAFGMLRSMCDGAGVVLGSL